MKWIVVALLFAACLLSAAVAEPQPHELDALSPNSVYDGPSLAEVDADIDSTHLKPRNPRGGRRGSRDSQGGGRGQSQNAGRSTSRGPSSSSKGSSKQSQAKVKLPAGMSVRRALTGGVSWALTRIQPLLFNISRMATRLSRASGVPLSDEGRDSKLDQDMKAAGVSFAEIEELAGHRIQTEEAEAVTAIPASYDFFAENPQCALPARFQGMCGSCVTFAVTNSLAHRLCKKGQLKKHLSVPYVLGCTAPPATNYTPMAMCASPTDPLDLVPVLQQGVYEDSCLKERESLYQCALFPPLLEMIDQFPSSFVSIADSLPCVSKWRKDKQAPQPAPSQTREQACPLSPSCGPKYKLTHIHGLTAPPSNDAEIQQWMRTIQREILTHGPVPAIISETPEQLYNYKSGVFSYTKPGSSSGGSKKEGDLTSLFLTTAHAISIVGWGELNGQPYWKIENSWSSQWGDKGFFLLARGKNMLGIESMAFALRTDGAGPVNYLAELKLTKIMFPFLGMIQLTLARKRTFSPRLNECVRMLHTLRTLLKVSGNDGAKKVAADKLVNFLVPYLGLKMGGEQNIAMSYQLLMMADSDIEDIALLSSPGLTEAAAALRTFAAASDPSKLSEAEVNAAKAFIADHRAAVLIFTGEDPNIPYANTKDGFKRTFFVKRADAEPTPQSIREFVTKHFSFLQKTVQYKLKKAGKF